MTDQERERQERRAASKLVQLDATAKPPRLGVPDIGPVRSYRYPEIKFKLENLLPAGHLIVITGDPGSGKSTLVTAMVGAISKGKPFAGLTTEKTTSLYLDRENPGSVVGERLERLGIEDGGDFRIWGGWVPQEPPDPTSPPILQWVESCVDKPVIVIDSFISYLRGSENDSAEVRSSMNRYRKLCNMGCTVLLVHHSGKSESAKSYRGSSDVAGSVDVGYHLANLSDPGRLGLMRLKSWKSRCLTASEIVFNYRNGEFHTGDPETRATTYDLLVGLLQQHPSVTAIEFETLAQDKGIARNRSRDFLKNGIQSGRIRVDKGDRNNKFHSWAEASNGLL